MRSSGLLLRGMELSEVFRSDVRVVCSVGLQPAPVAVALKALAAGLTRVVLVHGGDHSERVAGTIERFSRGVAPHAEVELWGFRDPYSPAAIAEVDGLAREVLLADSTEPDPGPWHLICGPGTSAMNVALASVWLGRTPERLWMVSTRDMKMVNGRGAAVALPTGCLLDFKQQIELRTDTTVKVTWQTSDNSTEAEKRDIERFARWTEAWRTGRELQLDHNERGPLLEWAVSTILRRLIADSGTVKSNVKVEFVSKRQSREIDAVVTDIDSARMTIVSCAQTQYEATKGRTLMRNKANEVRVLAANYFGSECQSLTVMMNQPSTPGQWLADGVRFDAAVGNRPNERHWIVSAQEIFGATAAKVRGSFARPEVVGDRLPGLRDWLVGSG